MNEEATQDEMSPEDAKAALGNATFLQEQLLGQQLPVGREAQVDEMNPSQEDLGMEAIQPVSPAEESPSEVPVEEPEPEMDVEVEMNKKIDDLRQELKGEIKQEMGELKKTLQELLNDK